MDSFMDKLAQKISAQEMMKMNTQAEASHVSSKQRNNQTEYDELLQDMRKLVYKNSEMVDQIQTLVDESTGKIARMQENTGSSLDYAPVIAEAFEDTKNELTESVDALQQSAESVREAARAVLGSNAETRQSVAALEGTMKEAVDQAAISIRQENKEIAEYLEGMRALLEEMKQIGMPEDSKEDEMKTEEEQKKDMEARKKELEELFQKMEEFVHKENVKVYRNVQAVVVEENKNQAEALLGSNKEIGKKFNGIKPLLIVTIVLMAANFCIGIFDLLAAIGIF